MKVSELLLSARASVCSALISNSPADGGAERCHRRPECHLHVLIRFLTFLISLMFCQRVNCALRWEIQSLLVQSGGLEQMMETLLSLRSFKSIRDSSLPGSCSDVYKTSNLHCKYLGAGAKIKNKIKCSLLKLKDNISISKFCHRNMFLVCQCKPGCEEKKWNLSRKKKI